MRKVRRFILLSLIINISYPSQLNASAKFKNTTKNNQTAQLYHIHQENTTIFPKPWHGTPYYRLTVSGKKRILLNNIFGVDIDSQAVEVTKLSLLLKVLEDENAQSLQNQHRRFHERALPDLAQNIKCGNSLIAPDFFDNPDRLAPPPVGEVLDQSCHSREACPRPRSGSGNPEELYKKINPFDWKQEFPKIFKRKKTGFNAVIGNPPWGALFSPEERAHLVARYNRVSTKAKDSYMYFVSRAIDVLRSAGHLGFILPNTWLLINNAKEYRQHLLSFDILEIVDYGDGVFKQATVESSTLLLANRGSFALVPDSFRGALCPMASGGFTITLPHEEILSNVVD